jgi:type II restriction/modification system DNA methylase subunit YeeA
MSNLTLPEFIARWQTATLTEKSGAQSHFTQLCQLLGVKSPTEADPTGKWYAFEKRAVKTGGGEGFADVWMSGNFIWEYKRPHEDLTAAYQQVLQYREDLGNPPLLIVCDLNRFMVHTNFENSAKLVYDFTLADLASQTPTPTCPIPPLQVLRAIFSDPDLLRPARTPEQVTEDAAAQFARLAESLSKRGAEPDRAAHFLMRLLFCLFAEDISNLLPNQLFSQLIENTRRAPEDFNAQIRQLFAVMAKGGYFGPIKIPYFNGGLFDDDFGLDLTSDDLTILARAASLDWSSIEPAIFGTLFERSLDPGKRSQLGQHYTSKQDILLIVRPVLMEPLKIRWAEVKSNAEELVAKRDADRKMLTERYAGFRRNIPESAYHKPLEQLLTSFLEQVGAIKVLDPACGSGNFLYVALKELLDLEYEVLNFAARSGVPVPFVRVDPSQLYGIEVSSYAYELASAVVWIGYIQWLNDNGFGTPSQPILKPLHNIRHMDAILAYDAEGKPVEPEWPEADVIIGNPPFLGDKKMRAELGDQYVGDLRGLYEGRVPGGADLVMYWFERARQMVERKPSVRVGLLSTNSIRQPVNRKVVERIKLTGDIFMAWSDRDWILEGAAVNVSILGFDNGTQQLRQLNGMPTLAISSDLRGDIDLTLARRLRENASIAFIGDTKKGQFDIPDDVASQMIQAPINPNGRPNSDVIFPWVNGLDITRRPRSMWIIDFGVNMPESEAALFEKPYEYITRNVKPERDLVRNPLEKSHWWLHARTAPDFRKAVRNSARYIATANVAKYRLFVWLSSSVIPDHQVTAIIREDDYFLGVLQSKPHELWSLRLGSTLEDRPAYRPSTTFETYPFPWPPGHEPKDDPRVEAIAEATRELVAKRDAWLNPPGATEAELKKRTLTNLYNEHPAWLDLAHKKLDRAVLDAYGWPHDLTDEQILERLLVLNLESAAQQGEPDRITEI